MKRKEFLYELKNHIPFTIIATLFAVIITLLLTYFIKKQISSNLFEAMHIVHLLASSIVTAGIYYKYSSKLFRAIIVGIIGAIFIGSLSDIIFPWIGGNLFGFDIHFHLPLLEKTFVVLGTALIGSFIGIKTKFTKIPHFIHVLASVFASLFYLLAFSQSFEIVYFVASFIIVFLAVIIPCCISDILFPFLFLKKNKKIKK